MASTGYRIFTSIVITKKLNMIGLLMFLLPYVVYMKVLDRQYIQRTDLKHHFVTKVPWIMDHSLGIIQCASTCVKHTGCVFVAFNNESLECHLFRKDNSTWSTEVKIGHRWLYYEEDYINIPFIIGGVVCNTDGYVTMESHCFKVHEDNKTFDDAKATCIMEGGRMAVLDNLATFLALNDYIRGNHVGMVGYQLGLTDRVVEGEWRWEDGNLIGDVPEFNRNQPNDNDRRYNGQGADCGYASVVWHTLHKAIDKLYDDNCDHPATFVCERVIV